MNAVKLCAFAMSAMLSLFVVGFCAAKLLTDLSDGDKTLYVSLMTAIVSIWLPSPSTVMKLKSSDFDPTMIEKMHEAERKAKKEKEKRAAKRATSSHTPPSIDRLPSETIELVDARVYDDDEDDNDDVAYEEYKRSLKTASGDTDLAESV
jgi:hypothetical protein